MTSRYNIGDTVLFKAKVSRIEQLPSGRILYYVNGVEPPILEEDIFAKIEEPWELKKKEM